MSISTALEPVSVAEHTRSCLRVFQVAQGSFVHTGATTDSVHALVSASLLDKTSQFRLRCGNIGAHRCGKSSLDHRLREASHIIDRVVGLLQRVQLLVGDIDAISTLR